MNYQRGQPRVKVNYQNYYKIIKKYRYYIDIFIKKEEK